MGLHAEKEKISLTPVGLQPATTGTDHRCSTVALGYGFDFMADSEIVLFTKIFAFLKNFGKKGDFCIYCE